METKKKDDLIEVIVLRAIGVDADPEIIVKEKLRAEQRGKPFTAKGLTKMIYPAKDGQKPVTIQLPRSVASKLSEAGAVRVVL